MNYPSDYLLYDRLLNKGIGLIRKVDEIGAIGLLSSQLCVAPGYFGLYKIAESFLCNFVTIIVIQGRIFAFNIPDIIKIWCQRRRTDDL